MHGDGWQLNIDENNWVTFFPYAWGWLETNKENTEESVFPLCMGMIGPCLLAALARLITSPMCGDDWTRIFSLTKII